MPRGVRANKTLDERIADLEVKINSLSEKKEKLVKERESAANQTAIHEILRIAKEKGKSPAEILSEIK